MVEDEELLRDGMGALLEGRGHQVAFAENGREALAWLHSHPLPEVIVLDLRMPVMNGWEFRAIQKSDPELAVVPVVAISADGSAQAAAISAQAYLHKPIDPNQLLATVESVLVEGARRESSSSDESRRFAHLKRLLASVGPEINNPLTLVMQNLARSLEDLHPSIRAQEKLGAVPTGAPGAMDLRLAGVTEMLQECQIGAERIRETVGNLQQLSDEGEEPSAWLDLHQLIEQSVARAWNQIRSRAQLVRAFGDIRPIFGDSGALRQVFRTILIGSAQSLPEDNGEQNEIRVATAVVPGEPNDEVIVEISQSGNQRAPDIAAGVFEDLSREHFGEGAGLALSIAQDTIRRHKGRMQVQSVLGKGKVFRVFLPASYDAAER